MAQAEQPGGNVPDKPAIHPVQDLVLIEDEPVRDHETDDLTLRPFSQIVAEAALGTVGPFTIGVFAEWGQGKTSVLRQAISLVRSAERPNVVPVWFNAWQFEREEHPIVPLVATIVKAIENHPKGFTESVAGYMKTMARGLRAVAYGFSSKATVKIPGLADIEAGFVAKEMIDRHEHLGQATDPLLERSLYYSAFETLGSLVDQADEPPAGERPQVLVFVDDLDRCSPEKGLHLLESIKLVLSQRGFVFVLAVHREVLERYLRKLYRERYDIEEYGVGTRYLDKIVQLPLALPGHERRFQAYVRDLVGRTVADSHPGAAVVFAELADLLAVATDHNPRNLVRLLNNLLVDMRLRTLTQSEATLSEQDFLGLATVSRALQQHLEGSYRLLARQQRLCDALLNEAKNTEATLETRFPGLESHLLGEPPEGEGPPEEPPGNGGARPEQRLSRPVRRLLDRLRAGEFLSHLLAHDYGKRWLREQHERQEVDQFFTTQREDQATVDPDAAATVDGAIRHSLGLSEQEPIGDDLRQSVTMLHLTDTPLSDLAPLAGLTGLQTLDLDNTGVSDLAPLAGLTGLQTLDLDGTEVSDLAPLAGLTGLQILMLASTGVSDLAPLAGLTGLQHLTLSRTGVSDLAPLANLTGLEHVELRGTGVSDLAPLAGLTGLMSISLGSTGVSDLAPLAGLTSLLVLRLNSTGVSDLAPLAGLTGLWTLTLYSTGVSDLAPLAGLTDLQTLMLDSTGVSDLAALAGLTGLRVLTLDSTGVSDLAPLAGLTGLRTLTLSRTGVNDLAPLAGLTGLQRLSLSRTGVSDLAPLAGLTSLQRLWLRDSGVGRKAIASLRKALPNCSIYA